MFIFVMLRCFIAATNHSCNVVHNMKKLYSFLLILVFVNCQNKKAEKVEFTYENGIEKIVMEIENGQGFLIYDQPTKTNFVLTNIDPFSLVIQGPGIKVLGTKGKTIMRTEINVPGNYLEKDTLTIKIRFGENYSKEHEFNIPLKKVE
ncbi:MAG: hypothetical protein COA50_15655 [Flavobacteriaceae bacterium]|nr:MAG: hypothetical protein COA50_15655 [Flavobacteriaceae bacterium]